MTATVTAAPWEVDDLYDYRALTGARLQNVVPVAEPLVLISQIQRSGGTLLLRLFDAHPECHVDPWELKIGHPKKYNWPPLDLGRPESWFEILFFPGISDRLRPGDRVREPGMGRKLFPFLISPRLQRAVFDAVAPPAGATERKVLDAYFTSYFNAWLDNQTLYRRPKRAVVGFTPRMSMDPGNLERYFAVYPDGTLISILRDPRAWYGSARKHRPQYEDVEVAMALWCESTDTTIEAVERYGERVLLITYEQLVKEPEQTMRHVAGRVGIRWDPVLLRPTFNGLPVKANSSEREQIRSEGIIAERADAFRESIDPQTLERIAELAGDRYERAAALA